MSHNYYVRCQCGESSERWNHAQDKLIQAIEQSYPLHLLLGTQWSLYSLQFNDVEYSGLASFLGQHFAHGGFQVCGEYTNDQPVDVVPESPAGYVKSVTVNMIQNRLDDLYALTKELEKRLEKR